MVAHMQIAVKPDPITIHKSVNDQFERWGMRRIGVIVDPSAQPFDENDIALFADAKRVPIIVNHPIFSVEHCPYLLEWDLDMPKGQALLARTVTIAVEDRVPGRMARGAGQRIGGWLACSEGAPALAAYWESVVLSTDERSRPTLLRFYDSRALALLWRICTERQRRALLGACHAWIALDGTDVLKTYQADPTLEGSFEWQPEQWQDIRRHGAINRALARYRYDGGALNDELIAVAVDAARRAEMAQIRDMDDAVLFIGHALTWHPHFDEHPAIVAALTRMNEETYYAEVIADIDAAQIETIQRGDGLTLFKAHAS